MKYLIVQDWDNTHGNHAGMVHMCRLLCEKYPNDYITIVKDCPQPIKIRSNKFLQKLLGWYDKMIFRRKYVRDYMRICQDMFSSLKDGDEVFLLEYNWPMTSQYELACYLKKHFHGVKTYALSHLTPSYFERQNNIRKEILKWDRPIDKHLTFGTSLTNYFQKVGIKGDKISTGLHYVDLDYYKKVVVDVNPSITVISIGALQRDFNLLANIVKGCNEVNWIICKGRKNIDDLFMGLENVQLVGYVDEAELRRLMSVSDLSLNVLEDTIGSNVIATSMAMGLGLIVSNVGSIHDYCDESNAVFCDNRMDSFISAIKDLSSKRERVLAMRKHSLDKAAFLDIKYTNNWFNTLNN